MDEHYMGTMPIPRLLVRFAAPALAGMLANSLYNIVDRVFVGQILGRDGLAAIALAFPTGLMLIALSMLISIGASSRVSIMLGEKRPDVAERTLGTSFLMAVVCGVAFMAIGIAFRSSLLTTSGASDRMYDLAESYYRYALCGSPFLCATIALSGQARACGHPAFAMGSQVIGALTNIALDALFVLCLDMGVSGAAIATSISQAISFVWSLSFFLRRSAVIRLRVSSIVRPDASSVARILAVGLPSCLNQINFSLINVVITNTVSFYGGDLAVSATGVFTSLDSLLFLPAMSVGEACQPIFGFNYGARKHDRIVDTLKFGVAATTFFYLLSFCTIMFAAEHLVGIFVSGDVELIELASKAMRVANIFLPLFGITIVNNSFMQGLGRGREALIASIVRFGIFLWIPLLTLPRFVGIFGAWGAFAFSDLAGAVIALILIRMMLKMLKREEKNWRP